MRSHFLISDPTVDLNTTVKSLAFQFLRLLIFLPLEYSESQTKATKYRPHKFIRVLKPLTRARNCILRDMLLTVRWLPK